MGNIHVVGPNKALLISGSGNKDPRVVVGGRAFVPILTSRCDMLSLELRTIIIESKRSATKHGVMVSVTGVCQVKISGFREVEDENEKSTLEKDVHALLLTAQHFIGQSDVDIRALCCLNIGRSSTLDWGNCAPPLGDKLPISGCLVVDRGSKWIVWRLSGQNVGVVVSLFQGAETGKRQAVMDSSPPPVDSPTFGTVFGCFSSTALGSIGCSSPAETPSEISKRNEVSKIGLLCLVAEYLAGTLRDLVTLGCVNKSLKCLILSGRPYEGLTSPATDQFWVASGRILGKVLMKGMSQTELEQVIAEPSFEYKVPEGFWLLARTSDSSETRNLLALEFLSDTDELRQHTQDCPEEGNLNTEGTNLRNLCFYLTRCQSVRPGRLFQVWKNSSFNSQHDILFSNQATDGLPKVNDVLHSFQFEEKLRSQTASFLERRKSAMGRGPPLGANFVALREESRFPHHWRQLRAAQIVKASSTLRTFLRRPCSTKTTNWRILTIGIQKITNGIYVLAAG